MDLKQKIKAEAARLGFCVCGFAPVQTPPHYAVYTRWLGSGRHAGMDYLARPTEISLRQDPARLLPGAKTILSLAAQYPVVRARGFQGSHRSNTTPVRARGFQGFLHSNATPVPLQDMGLQIATYAQVEDYHLLLPTLMDALADFIQQECGQQVVHKSFTDAVPLIERDFAALAGLGWIGKNSCLISPQYGSFLLLGEILLDLELEADAPFPADRCGTCQRCIQACPTGCILPDRTMDAGRCISYLTIENKSSIPLDLRPKIGGWIFGCDVCQQVCPWNSRAAGQESISLFSRQTWVYSLDINQEVHLSLEDFNRKFRTSPIKRAKRRGYLRNIAVVLGNQADPANLAALQYLLLDESEALVRGHAAWAVGRTGTPAARKLLETALQAETEPDVRLEILTAMENFQG